MYRGLARLVGHDSRRARQDHLPTRWRCSKPTGSKYDFFFIHYKYTDSTGEDGDFAKKVEVIEALDAEIPKLVGTRARRPDRHGRPLDAQPDEVAQLPPCAAALWAPATAGPTW